MNHASLFSGIGGFDLAADWMGWHNVLQCEWDGFCQQILQYYWPDADLYSDITKTDFKPYYGTVDIISGGFPCQPYSSAGKRQGTEDDRHLWPEMLRAVREIAPRFVVGENVLGILNWNGGMVFEEVCADLESEGYEVQSLILPAAGVNAPHRRERTLFIAYSESNGNCGRAKLRDSERKGNTQKQRTGFRNQYIHNGKKQSAANTKQPGLERKNGERMDGTEKPAKRNVNWQHFPTQSPICGGDDGLPTGLDGITFSKWRNESIKGYGNAIVPQVAFQIFKAIEETIYHESTRP